MSKQNVLFRSKVTAILKKWPIFADFDFSADVSMVIYSFYVWFFNTSNWKLPGTKFYVYMTSLSKVIEGGLIHPSPGIFETQKTRVKIIGLLRLLK